MSNSCSGDHLRAENPSHPPLFGYPLEVEKRENNHGDHPRSAEKEGEDPLQYHQKLVSLLQFLRHLNMRKEELFRWVILVNREELLQELEMIEKVEKNIEGPRIQHALSLEGFEYLKKKGFTVKSSSAVEKGTEEDLKKISHMFKDLRYGMGPVEYRKIRRIKVNFIDPHPIERPTEDLRKERFKGKIFDRDKGRPTAEEGGSDRDSGSGQTN